MYLNNSPFGSFLPRAQKNMGSGANTNMQRSFRLTSKPPPGMDSTRCVRACDQPKPGGFGGDGAIGCGKPKSRGCGAAEADTASLAARLSSSAQSAGG